MSGRALIYLWAECNSVVALTADRDTAKKNNYCEVPIPREQLPEAAPILALKCWGSIVILMIVQSIVVGVGQFLSLALVYALRFTTLNPALCHILSQWGDQGK